MGIEYKIVKSDYSISINPIYIAQGKEVIGSPVISGKNREDLYLTMLGMMSAFGAPEIEDPDILITIEDTQKAIDLLTNSGK